MPLINPKNNGYIIVGFRCHCTEAQDHYFMYNFIEWLKYRKYVILHFSTGIHTNTEHRHFHMAFYVTGTKLSNPVSTIKRDCETGAFTAIPSCGLDAFTALQHKGKINFSIQMSMHPEDDIDLKRFLQYPLKEGALKVKPQFSDLSNYKYTLGELTNFANIEYEESIHKHEQKKVREVRTLSDWDKYVEYLDKYNNFESHQDVFRKTIQYHKDLGGRMATGKFMLDNSERYSIMRDILTTEDLISKYFRFI